MPDTEVVDVDDNELTPEEQEELDLLEEGDAILGPGTFSMLRLLQAPTTGRPSDPESGQPELDQQTHSPDRPKGHLSAVRDDDL